MVLVVLVFLRMALFEIKHRGRKNRTKTHPKMYTQILRRPLQSNIAGLQKHITWFIVRDTWRLCHAITAFFQGESQQGDHHENAHGA